MKTFTVEEAAKIFHVNIKTIYRWLEDGRLKAVRPGRKYLITEKSINKLLKR